MKSEFSKSSSILVIASLHFRHSSTMPSSASSSTRSAVTHFLLYYTNKFDNKIQRSSSLGVHFNGANARSQNDLNNMHNTKFVYSSECRWCLSTTTIRKKIIRAHTTMIRWGPFSSRSNRMKRYWSVFRTILIYVPVCFRTRNLSPAENIHSTRSTEYPISDWAFASHKWTGFGFYLRCNRACACTWCHQLRTIIWWIQAQMPDDNLNSKRAKDFFQEILNLAEPGSTGFCLPKRNCGTHGITHTRAHTSSVSGKASYALRVRRTKINKRQRDNIHSMIKISAFECFYWLLFHTYENWRHT